jgi:hypothetical protein
VLASLVSENASHVLQATQVVQVGQTVSEPLQVSLGCFPPSCDDVCNMGIRSPRFLANHYPYSLLPGARNRHCGPRDGGITKGPKKKGAMKKSTQRRELLFGGTTDGMDSTIQPCLPTELSKDTCTNTEKAELMAWVRPRHALFPSSVPSLTIPPTQACRGAIRNEIERQEDIAAMAAAKNQPASSVLMAVSRTASNKVSLLVSNHSAQC